MTIFRHAFFFAALSMSALSAAAYTTVDLQGESFRVDTLRHYKAGPGLYHTQLRLASQSVASRKMNVFVITADVDEADRVEFRVGLGNDSIHTVERISAYALRHSNANEHYIAGVNSDFFITWAPWIGVPNQSTVIDGQIATTTSMDTAPGVRGHMILDRDGTMWCDTPVTSFSLTVDATGATFPIREINNEMNCCDNDLIFSNQYRGKSTKFTSTWTTEVAVVLAEGETWRVNSPVKVKVVGDVSTSGNMKIPSGGGVISAGQAAAAAIANLKDGDSLTLNFTWRLANNNLSPDIKEIAGGDVVILKDGVTQMEADRFINARDGYNPRTMAGCDKTRRRHVWCAVDGRSPQSAGCTYPQGADIMRFLGCHEAVNFDGGGSTGMWLETSGIVNRPSDGQERAVAEGLYAVLLVPEDNTIAEIRFLDQAMQFPKYGIYKPVIYGYNKYGQLISTNVEGFSLSCPSSLGEIVDGGDTFFGNGDGYAALTATYNGLTASLPVNVVGTSQPLMRHSEVVLDRYHPWTVEVQADVNGTIMDISPQAFAWTSSNENVATVDASGTVQAIENGNADIIGNVADFTGTVKVNVENPTSRLMPILEGVDLSTLKTSKSGIKEFSLSPLADGGIAIDYVLSSTRSPLLTITTNRPIYGLPDAIQLQMRPGNAVVNAVTVSATANGASAVKYSVKDFEGDDVKIVSADIGEFVNPVEVGSYPLQLNSIALTFGGTTNTNYHLELPRIDGLYLNAPDGVECVTSDEVSSVVVASRYYNLQGQPLSCPQSGQAVIRVDIFDNGGMKAYKTIGVR